MPFAFRPRAARPRSTALRAFATLAALPALPLLPRGVPLALACATMLSACGGGSDGAPAFPASPAPEAGLPHQLTGWAALPAAARWPGPVTGQFTAASLGVTPPFTDGQPIPGFSGLLKNDDGTWTALPDNGYGSKANSPDYLLGFYNIGIDFRTEGNGTATPGAVRLNRFVGFNDARGFLKDGRGVDLRIVADYANYPTVADNRVVESARPVDARIRAGRLLTGFDFDVESIARAADGTFYVGEEFGPYILHFGADGTLLGDPVPHPVLRSPSHPDVLAGRAAANSLGSRGFESLAFDADRARLWAVPEAAPSLASLQPVAGDERYLNFFEFDPAASRYTGATRLYRKDGAASGNAIVIGDMTNVGGSRYVLIERDGQWGARAAVKRLYLVDLNEQDADGALRKTLLVDLLRISDPRNIGGGASGAPAGRFTMPFDSIESVEVVDANTLAVAIDTNYPTEDGRRTGRPDDTEIATLRFDQPLFDRGRR
jgi:hypothetical protein